MCASTRYLLFSFWLTSLCITGTAFFFFQNTFLGGGDHFLKSLFSWLQYCPFSTFGFLSVRHVGSWLPDQGLNLHLLHWKASLNQWTLREVPSLSLSPLNTVSISPDQWVSFCSMTLNKHLLTFGRAKFASPNATVQEGHSQLASQHCNCRPRQYVVEAHFYPAACVSRLKWRNAVRGLIQRSRVPELLSQQHLCHLLFDFMLSCPRATLITAASEHLICCFIFPQNGSPVRTGDCLPWTWLHLQHRGLCLGQRKNHSIHVSRMKGRKRGKMSQVGQGDKTLERREKEWKDGIPVAPDFSL